MYGTENRMKAADFCVKDDKSDPMFGNDWAR